MSNIVVSEEQILNAERIRLLQATNLRKIGVGCFDNETMEILVNRTATAKTWKSFFKKELSGTIYDDELTLIPEFQSFADIDNIIFMIGTTQSGNNCYGSTNLKNAVFPSRTSISSNGLSGCNMLELLDAGVVTDITSKGTTSKANFKKLILRQTANIVTLTNSTSFNNTPFNTTNGNAIVYVPSALISTYENATNWSALLGTTFIGLEGSRFEFKTWWNDRNSKCTLDGNQIEVLDNETVAIFKHTENISHCYENGVELQDTDLVKDKVLTSTI